MSTGIRKAAVLGGGVMGSGIAAHLASCGIRTVMMDIVPPDLPDAQRNDPAARNRLADEALAKARKAKPALFFRAENAHLVETGNLDDDLARIADCDWVVEVVKEDMDVKRSLLERVEQHWTPGTIVSTNTSGLSIDGMLEGRSADFARHFLGTHFFNPVRYMHLLEIIPGERTDRAVVDRMADVAQRFLGKGVVYAKDTPNFIANRVGVYAMMATMHLMQELDYRPEEVDAIVGRPMGRPKSAAFRTADMVGLDTFVHVADNCWNNLPDDPEREMFRVPDFMRKMVEQGLLGQKTNAGFYRKEGDTIYALDLNAFEWRERDKPSDKTLKEAEKLDDPRERVAKLLADEGRAGTFAWKVLSRTLAYTARIAWEIADDVVNVDRAMRWGFNWEIGPFETWQALGVRETAERMRADGLEVPAWVDRAAEAGGFYAEGDRGPQCFTNRETLEDQPPVPGKLSLARHHTDEHVVERNAAATLLDLGDGIACLEFHTKMNTVDPDLMSMVQTACDVVERDFDGLVLANEGDNFSAGANIMMIVMAASQQKWDQVRDQVRSFQQANQRLTYLSKPVVSAPHGMTLGGGCELAMAADRMVVDKETYMGLVEAGVGLVPGGAGNLNLLKRLFQGVPASADPREYDRLPIVRRAFEAIGLGKVATGGGEAFDYGFGTFRDEIAVNRDRRIADARSLCRYLADRGYTPPAPATNLVLPGRHGAATLDLGVYGMMLGGWASEHDRKIGRHLAHVLCGGDTNGREPVSEDYLLELEREAFLSLAGEPKTMERMQHMLKTNKPLRN